MKEVSKEEYLKAFEDQELKPIASFSDPDGVLGFGYGRPAMDTDWGTGDSEQPIARCEMRKDNQHDKEWEYTYFLNISKTQNFIKELQQASFNYAENAPDTDELYDGFREGAEWRQSRLTKIETSSTTMLNALTEIAEKLDCEEMNINSKEYELWKIANTATGCMVG